MPDFCFSLAYKGATMEVLHEVQQIVSDLLNVDMNKVTANTQQQDLPEWDSLAQLRIMNAIEQEFGVSPTMKQISQLTSIPAITEFVKSSPASH